jgi:hypothetical protein
MQSRCGKTLQLASHALCSQRAERRSLRAGRLGTEGMAIVSVIEHDFGLTQKLAERRFGKLLELDALHEANIRGNPLPYLERASERIFRLQAAMFDAIQAAKAPPPPTATDEFVTVGKDEYERLKNCLALLEKSFAEYGAQDDSF